MNLIKKMIISEALTKHKKIFPVGNFKAIDDCFTIDDDKLIFWFNTEDQTTHVEVVDLNFQGDKTKIKAET